MSPFSLQPGEKWGPLGGGWGQRRAQACLPLGGPADRLGLMGWCKAFVSELPMRDGPGDMGCHVSPGAAPREEVCPGVTSLWPPQDAQAGGQSDGGRRPLVLPDRARPS